MLWNSESTPIFFMVNLRDSQRAYRCLYLTLEYNILWYVSKIEYIICIATTSSFIVTYSNLHIIQPRGFAWDCFRTKQMSSPNTMVETQSPGKQKCSKTIPNLHRHQKNSLTNSKQAIQKSPHPCLIPRDFSSKHSQTTQWHGISTFMSSWHILLTFIVTFL